MNVLARIDARYVNATYVLLFLVMLAGLTLCRLCIEPASIMLAPLTVAVFRLNGASIRPLLASPAFILTLLFLVAAALSLIFNGLPAKGADNIINWLLAIAIGYTATMLLGERLLPALGMASLAALAAYPLIAGAIELGLLDATMYSAGRLKMNSIHPNRLGALLGVFIVLCVGLAVLVRRLWIRLVACAGFALLVIMLFQTGSRSAMLGVAVALPVLLLAAYAHRWKRLLVSLGLLALASFSLAAMFSDHPQVQRLETGLSAPLADPTLQSRLVIWHVAWNAFLEKPALGAGFEQFKRIYWTEITAHGEELDRQFPIVERFKHPHAHNFFFHLLAETGLAGTLLMTGLWLYLIVSGFRLKPAGMAVSACLLCLLVTFQLDMSMYGREQSTLAFLLIGIQTRLMTESRATAVRHPLADPVARREVSA